jgi:hypothetical protein
MDRETLMMKALRRLFALLSVLPAGDWLAWRLARLRYPHARKKGDTDWDAARMLKAQWLDLYILLCLAAEIAFFIAGPSRLAWLFWILAGYRLLEITRVFVTGVLFDESNWERQGLGEYTVLSAERTMVQHVLLFLEIPLLCGIFYFLLRDDFGLQSSWDALAYSIGTLTTLGDPSGATHAAEGGWRFLALAQVLYGFLAGVIVLGRVISLLPPVKAWDRMPADDPVPPAAEPAPKA